MAQQKATQAASVLVAEIIWKHLGPNWVCLLFEGSHLDAEITPNCPMSCRGNMISACCSSSVPSTCGCGSKLNRRGYAGFGPCFHLPGFHFGTGFLSHSHMWAISQHDHPHTGWVPESEDFESFSKVNVTLAAITRYSCQPRSEGFGGGCFAPVP